MVIDGGRISDYELKLMDLDVEQVALPEMVYDVSVKMPSDEFQRVCRDLAAVGESVTIDATKESVRFSVRGDLGSGSVAIRSGGMAIDKKDTQLTAINMRQPACVSVSLKFLSQFTKATPLSETVRVEFSNDCPMLVEYPIGDMGYIRFYLAPKVDDEEDK